MPKHALLIGNGLNRTCNNAAWDAMVSGLAKEWTGAKCKCDDLPMEFERIWAVAKTKNTAIEKIKLKRSVLKYIPELKDLKLHQSILELRITDVLTTNYDYYLEKALDEQFAPQHPHTRRRKYNNERFYSVADKNIWHIHGECERPQSICLGYMDYLDHLVDNRTFLNNVNGNEKPKPYRSYLKNYMLGENVDTLSWLPLFFSHHIHIVGFGLGFIETDLWWLLHYRFQLLHKKNGFPIKNEIHFYHIFNESEDEDNKAKKNNDVNTLLRDTNPQLKTL